MNSICCSCGVSLCERVRRREIYRNNGDLLGLLGQHGHSCEGQDVNLKPHDTQCTVYAEGHKVHAVRRTMGVGRCALWGNADNQRNHFVTS